MRSGSAPHFYLHPLGPGAHRLDTSSVPSSSPPLVQRCSEPPNPSIHAAINAHLHANPIRQHHGCARFAAARRHCWREEGFRGPAVISLPDPRSQPQSSRSKQRFLGSLGWTAHASSRQAGWTLPNLFLFFFFPTYREQNSIDQFNAYLREEPPHLCIFEKNHRYLGL